MRQATLAALPEGSDHLRDAAADLVSLCKSTAERASLAAPGAQLWKRLVQQLRARLDRLLPVLDPILELGPSEVACRLPGLQRLNSVTREAEALIADFSGMAGLPGDERARACFCCVENHSPCMP